MSKPNTLAVKLKPAGERSVKQGHPWVFSESIDKINKEGKAGDLAIIFEQRRNTAIGIGLYDPSSPIRIKIIHNTGGAKVDAAFFEAKIKKAFDLRKPLLKKDINAYRLLFGENDGMPGLIVDVYNKVGVIKVYSAIWLPYLTDLFTAIVEIASLEALVIRWNRQLQAQETPYKEGEVVFGDLKSTQIRFTEYGVHFEADVVLGHKTGFFLDHRENRHKVGKLSKDKTVLDVFSYAGGFSVHALAGGAKEVTSLDVSEQALELAKQNAKLNPHKGAHHILAGDAFEELKKLVSQKKKYDVVVIDPPAFAKSRKEENIALRKYAELAEIGVELTNKNGVLVLASCSSRISEEVFLKTHFDCFTKKNVSYKLLETTTHALDHPISFEEGTYLKTAYYKIR